MLDDEIIPRLLAMSGIQSVVSLERFHSFGLGESRVDNMLKGVEDLAEGGDVKLGFQAHYPQLETKLFARGATAEEVERRVAPVVQAVRETLGSYLLAEGTQTLEGVILDELGESGATLAVAEHGTNGAVAGRLAAADPRGAVFQRGALGATIAALGHALGLTDVGAEPGLEVVGRSADAVREGSGTDLGLAVSVVAEEKPGEGWIYIAVSRGDGPAVTRSACIVGGPERVRVGGVEMGLDCLRRLRQGLPTQDPIDFEKQPAA